MLLMLLSDYTVVAVIEGTLLIKGTLTCTLVLLKVPYK